MAKWQVQIRTGGYHYHSFTVDWGHEVWNFRMHQRILGEYSWPLLGPVLFWSLPIFWKLGTPWFRQSYWIFKNWPYHSHSNYTISAARLKHQLWLYFTYFYIFSLLMTSKQVRTLVFPFWAKQHSKWMVHCPSPHLIHHLHIHSIIQVASCNSYNQCWPLLRLIPFELHQSSHHSHRLDHPLADTCLIPCMAFLHIK
jgi:hypothetical protein